MISEPCEQQAGLTFWSRADAVIMSNTRRSAEKTSVRSARAVKTCLQTSMRDVIWSPLRARVRREDVSASTRIIWDADDLTRNGRHTAVTCSYWRKTLSMSLRLSATSARLLTHDLSKPVAVQAGR